MSRELPAWATTVEPLDEERQFSCVLGSVLADGEPPLPVEIIQVEQERPQLVIAGHRHDLDQAAALAPLIQTGLSAVLITEDRARAGKP
jgi:hypothetical protein